MKFGAFFLLGSPQLLLAEEMYRRLFDWVEPAERLGYDSVWFTEHHFSNYGYIPNPLMMVVKVGQITSCIRISGWTSNSDAWRLAVRIPARRRGCRRRPQKRLGGRFTENTETV